MEPGAQSRRNGGTVVCPALRPGWMRSPGLGYGGQAQPRGTGGKANFTGRWLGDPAPSGILTES